MSSLSIAETAILIPPWKDTNSKIIVTNYISNDEDDNRAIMGILDATK